MTVGPAYFEGMYAASPDPWGFQSRWYERRKYALTLALLPAMVARGSGRIVSIASVAATLSPPGESAYSASKAALAVFSESMAVDLWDTGVKVTVVYPGVVDTELFTLPDNDPFAGDVESITVEEAAATIVEGMAEGQLSIYVPGYFAEFAAAKANDVGGFLEGTAAYARNRAGKS